jgi:hypothetical protein
MALSRERFNIRPVIIVLLVIASQVVPASLSTTRKSALDCVQLKQWAQANARTLPRTLDTFAQLDRGRRHAAFNVLSASDRASMWREQMQRFLQRTDLTIAARALATESLTVLKPESFASPAEARAASKALADRVTGTFMIDDHRQAFIDLGALGRKPQDPWTSNRLLTAGLMTAGPGALLDRLAASATVEAQICECDVFDWTNSQCSWMYGNWCSWSWYLFCFSWRGCGPFWDGECNSLCDWI